MTDMSDNINSVQSLTKFINFYFSIIIIPIGIVLNILTIIIFSTQKNRERNISNMNILYIALCVYDILALFNSVLFAQLLPSLDIILINYSDILCKLLSLWRKTIIQSPSWIQVLITVDRFRSVVCYNRFTFLKKKSTLIIMLILIFVIFLVVNMDQIWFYTIPVVNFNVVFDASLNQSQNVTTQSLLCTSTSEVSLATDTINVIFRFFVPFFLMLVMNILLSKNVIDSKKKTNHNKIRSFRRECNYTLTVIGLNLIFFLLNLPWAIWYILSHINSLQTPNGIISLNFLNGIAYSIFYLNNLSSFFLNLIFNRLFRKQLFNLLKFKFSANTYATSQEMTHVTPTVLNFRKNAETHI